MRLLVISPGKKEDLEKDGGVGTLRRDLASASADTKPDGGND